MTSIEIGESAAARPPRKLRWIILGGVLTLAMVVAGVLFFTLRHDRTVRMEVTTEGTRAGTITSGYDRELRLDSQAPAIEAGAVTETWSREIETPDDARSLRLSVTNRNMGQGTVTCRLIVDGEVRKEHTHPQGAICDIPAKELFQD